MKVVSIIYDNEYDSENNRQVILSNIIALSTGLSTIKVTKHKDYVKIIAKADNFIEDFTELIVDVVEKLNMLIFMEVN